MKSSTARNYSDLPGDFADFHSYCNSALLLSYGSTGYNGKSCTVGECGYLLAGANRAAMEVQVAEDYVQEALRSGCSSCLVWNRDDFTSDANNASIAQGLT